MCVEERVPGGSGQSKGNQKATPLSPCGHPVCSQILLSASIPPPTKHYHRNHCILGNHVPAQAITHHPSQPPTHLLDDKLIKCKLCHLPRHIIQTVVWYILGLNKCLNESIRILLKIKNSLCNIRPVLFLAISTT